MREERDKDKVIVDDEHRQIEDSATAKNEYNATKTVKNEDGWDRSLRRIR